MTGVPLKRKNLDADTHVNMRTAAYMPRTEVQNRFCPTAHQRNQNSDFTSSL